MATEQTEAIVLRCTEFSETSLVVTLYTRDLGRVSAIAKGARRPKGPFDSALDLLAVCRVVLIHKASDALDLVTEANLVRRFRSASRCLVRLHCGYYLAELLRMWTFDGQRNQPLYELATSAVARIDGDADPLWGLIRFELRALSLLGHAPATRDCVDCGQRVDLQQRRTAFAYHLGGVLCQACRSRHGGVASLRRDVLGHVAALAGPAEPVGAPPLADYRELRAVVSRCVNASLQAAPRTQSLLPATWVSH